jgi:hypothetical protein
MYMDIYVYVYVYVYIYIYIYTHTHTHIHINTSIKLQTPLKRKRRGKKDLRYFNREIESSIRKHTRRTWRNWWKKNSKNTCLMY